ncbi:DUF4105 domain-containing protein [Sesbania bispinosa]|nr:DUF4105 domain-containing protein [Sesbania bispinosa]
MKNGRGTERGWAAPESLRIKKRGAHDDGWEGRRLGGTTMRRATNAAGQLLLPWKTRVGRVPGP